MDLIQHVVAPEKMNYHAFGFITVSGTPEYSFLLFCGKGTKYIRPAKIAGHIC